MMLAAALQMSLTFFIAATANSEEQTLFLERGYQGIVPCNPDAARKYRFDDLESVYWYFGQYDRDHFIFSYFQGDLYEGEGIPKGMYNISNDFSLIIKNVTDSDEGTYYYRVEPLLGRTYQGSVEVAVKVTTKQPFPVVPGCDPRPLVTADSCIAHEPYDILSVSLTCQLNHAKPPADLQWLRVFDDGHTEHIEATLTTKLLVNKPGLFFIDNTYTSLSSFHLSPTSDNITRYRCEAYGVALGDRNGSHVSVTVSKDAFPSHAVFKVFLDRGRRGIVPCSPDAARAHQRGDLQGVYWYFRQRDREHVIFSYFQGATVPLDGIPEGMYNVTSNFSLIIQNVTDSHEGTYHYVVESKVGQIDKGSVEVVITVTAPQPFPVVPGCDPRPSGPDTCMLQVPYDTMTVNLTCQVDHAKPPVDLQWFRVFHNGYTEHVESTTTTTMLVYQPGSSFDNTYVSSSMFHLSPTSNDSMVYRCDAYGVALGDKNGSHVLVTVSRDQLSIDTGTTQETASSSPPKNVQTALIDLVVIFGLLSLFFSIILLILLIRHCRLKMVGGNIATNGMEMNPITSDESSPMLHGTEGARSAPYPPWESLASRLGYNSEDIAYFKSIHPGQPEEQIWLMLIDWRGKGSSPVANTTNLCHALAAFGGKDLAFELQRLNDRDLQNISRDLDDKWKDLALELGMNNGELLKLEKRKAKLQKKAYDVLDTWRKRQSTKEDGPKVLYTALDKVGKEDLANKLRKENKSFLGRMRRLYKVACMLTPEHDREVFMSEEFQLPPRLVITCHGDLKSLRNDLKDVSERLEVNKLTIWCRSLEDLEFLRELIQSNKIIDAPVQLELAIILSTQWKEQLQCLRETFKPEMKFCPLYLALYGHAGDDCHDMKSVGNCLCHISNIFPKRFGTSLLDMIRSPEDVKSLVNAVRGCKLRLFGCPGTDLNGHVRLLAPLNTAYLEELWLSDCNLKDDDVSDLKDILLEGRKLQWLNIGTNKFSVDGISNITGHLTRERFPNLYRLDVEYKGPDVAQVSEVVVRNLPHLKETDTGIFQLLK